MWCGVGVEATATSLHFEFFQFFFTNILSQESMYQTLLIGKSFFGFSFTRI